MKNFSKTSVGAANKEQLHRAPTFTYDVDAKAQWTRSRRTTDAPAFAMQACRGQHSSKPDNYVVFRMSLDAIRESPTIPNLSRDATQVFS
jgi:hypothetical protein